MNQSQERLNEIRSALQNASSGKWVVSGKEVLQDIYDRDDFRMIICKMNVHRNKDNDAHLISKAPEWIALLLDEVQRLQAVEVENDRYKRSLRKIICLNIPMPDEVFNLANDALEGVGNHE